MIEFIRSGRIGALGLGMSRRQVLRALGPPSDWAGKPPHIGQTITAPEDSPVWFYYRAAGILFDVTGISTEVTLKPDQINPLEKPFLLWPVGPGLTNGDFRAYLLENGIPFEEGADGEPDGYYILAGGLCHTISFPFGPKGGERIPAPQREIVLIGRVARKEHLPSHIRR
jgi:hypothetical protein